MKLFPKIFWQSTKLWLVHYIYIYILLISSQCPKTMGVDYSHIVQKICIVS